MKATQKKNFDPELKQFGAYLFFEMRPRVLWSFMCKFTIAENPNSGEVYQQLRQNKGCEDVTRFTPRIEFDTASNE
jgi:hypothetical protein